MASIETCIEMALRTKVKATITDYDVDYMDGDFDRPSTGGVPDPHVEFSNLPNTVDRVLISSNGPHNRQGILQLTLCYPVALKHSTLAMREIAGQIAAQFEADEPLFFEDIRTTISDEPSVAAPYRDDAYWRVPVSVRWRCWSPRPTGIPDGALFWNGAQITYLTRPLVHNG